MERLMLVVLVLGALVMKSGVAAKSSEEDDGPSNFRYVQLWVSEDGETHIRKCKMTGFVLEAYSNSLPQWVKDEFGGKPTKMVFTELPVGNKQPLHSAPSTQFVVTLSGSWYIKTTDGAEHIFKKGEVLFQDNTKQTPAKSIGQHYSGNAGDVPNQQFVVQFDRPPEVDNPCPF